MNLESLGSVGATMSGGFIAGAFIGYALKKVLKLLAIAVGLFLAGLTFLQYQQILTINWNKFQVTSQHTISELTNATMKIPGFDNNHTQVLSNLGIPLTGSMAMGFGIGFMKG